VTERAPVPIEDRIWDRVQEDPNGCWVWVGCVTAAGYGKIAAGRSHEVRQHYVHRWVYEYVVGKIPAGLVIDHLCRNRRCCNPAHLQPVTDRENRRRGVAPHAINARKTHCKRGHALTEDNVQQEVRGRKCLKCKRAGEARRHREGYRRPSRA
jgi:hypothetical protein